MKKTASISARISPETKERLQAHAEATDQTSSQLLEKAINHYLDEIQNVTQNVMQYETHDVTQNVRQTETPETSALENRLEALEFELKKLRLDANGNADKLNQLDKNAVKIPDMEGISCALYQDSLRDRVTQLENWKGAITDCSQANQDSISELRGKIEALETAKNDKTPATVEKSKGFDATTRSRESEEETSQRSQDKNRQHRTNSTDTALIEESAIALLTQSALGKRLGCSGEAIRKQRDKESFKEWSQKRDPDGIAWQYGEDKKYHPVN